MRAACVVWYEAWRTRSARGVIEVAFPGEDKRKIAMCRLGARWKDGKVEGLQSVG